MDKLHDYLLSLKRDRLDDGLVFSFIQIIIKNQTVSNEKLPKPIGYVIFFSDFLISPFLILLKNTISLFDLLMYVYLWWHMTATLIFYQIILMLA